MTDEQRTRVVEVDTDDAARARWHGPRDPWPGLFVAAWTIAVLVLVAVPVYENAFRYRDVGVSFWIGLAWALPVLVVVYGLHALLYRRGGSLAERQDAPYRRAAARVVAAARAAGLPEPAEDGVLRMLRARDNGPEPGTGERGGPDRPLLRWELPLAGGRQGRSGQTLVAERTGTPGPRGTPERTLLSLTTRPPAADAAVGRRSTARTRAGTPSVDAVDEADTTLVLGAYRSDFPAPLTASRIGGAPAVPHDWEWPRCVEHEEPMQFTAQIEHRGTLVSVFLCQFDPGTCDSWEADSGANAAFVFAGRDLVPADEPVSPHGDPDDPDPVYPPLLRDSMLLGTVAVPVRSDDEDPDRALEAAEAAGVVVAGQYGGAPVWIQEDETPDGMAFVASIEPGPLGFDLGDAGRAYVFSDGARASVLWQSS